jgi:hypothetical protein
LRLKKEFFNYKEHWGRRDKYRYFAQCRMGPGLLRVPFFEVEGGREIVTVYWAIQINRYWRPDANLQYPAGRVHGKVAGMHRAGLKFGLSQGLLELKGASFVVSPQLLENISGIARRKIRSGKRVTDIWNVVMAGGLRKTAFSLAGVPREEYQAFFAAIDGVVMRTMTDVANEIHMGRRCGLFFATDIRYAQELNKYCPRLRSADEDDRVRFRQTYAAIIGLCKRYGPDHLRHAELLTLCDFNTWLTSRGHFADDELPDGG